MSLTSVEIDGVKYEVGAIPPYLLPYMNLYGDLSLKDAKTFQEAKDVEDQMREIVEKVLDETVSPKPKKAHETELFRTVNAMTRQIVDQIDAKFFPNRQAQQDNKNNSGTPKPDAASKANVSSRDGKKGQ